VVEHKHEWPLLPNPTCMVMGCPGAEVEDYHEHCVRCGGINPDSVYGDQARHFWPTPLDVEVLARVFDQVMMLAPDPHPTPTRWRVIADLYARFASQSDIPVGRA